ncbi:MAG: GMC family oxidoreductase N-terminal domain-containing protein [Proteobacteria bacterium]|nr:GMC family oxidoreductase N-terminal domain-containing protein [Pseudomonadota bacterium]
MNTEHDYVVVGAGTAGCVVAARLAEAGHSVLLLEAGGSDLHPMIQIPIGYGRTFFDRRLNWMYDTQPVPGLNGRTSYWPRGKVVGGSGSINAMVHVRGLPHDFDDWAEMGNPGWDWQAVLPHFIRAEDSEIEEPGWRGKGGPQHVTDMRRRVHPLCDNFFAAGRELGLPESPDFNGSHPEGLGIWQIDTRAGWRSSTANAYLHRTPGRSNIELVTRAQATRLLFDGARAVGVDYRRGRVSHSARARREVIVAAGSIASPQLLQMSGIGDGARLQALGIGTLRHLPGVGGNMQDHLAISYFYRSRKPTLNELLSPFTGKVRAALRYLWDRGGPLSASINQAGGFVRGTPDAPRPNLQLYFAPVSYTLTPLAERKLANPDPFPAFLLSFNACRPTSRGWLHITSTDPRVQPEIHPNYLSTQHDIDEAIEGIRLLHRFERTGAMAELIERQIVPAQVPQDEAGWLEDFRNRADTVYHPTSTCMMGPDPASAVVDARLRVHGIGGLRVIDASVFPTVTSGNTNAPTVMVAEKGAAMVLEDAGALV